MKPLLDWQTKEVVSIYDELSLWAAPFGRLLLDNIPMVQTSKVLDLGFGTGFPLIELAQRFGEKTQVFGMDIWSEALKVARNKAEILDLKNIKIIEASAEKIPFENDYFDLICSNLGVNNFEHFDLILEEIYRALHPSGHFCFTTNDDSTFKELYTIFIETNKELGYNTETVSNQMQERGQKEGIIKRVERADLKLQEFKKDETFLRFTDANAVLDYSLIRIGFRAYWNFVSEDSRNDFFHLAMDKIKQVIQDNGEFRMTIPILYFSFSK
ncbi:MAG: class I SAM-dependent methyltransferase [Flavobacteriales bacterium]|nr:class I SAM-dependent methyltransferase [Flavobacteriales bacterium]